MQANAVSLWCNSGILTGWSSRNGLGNWPSIPRPRFSAFLLARNGREDYWYLLVSHTVLCVDHDCVTPGYSQIYLIHRLHQPLHEIPRIDPLNNFTHHLQYKFTLLWITLYHCTRLLANTICNQRWLWTTRRNWIQMKFFIHYMGGCNY
jgi:uncharacterized membrane protein YhaH (DUF805 family)